MGLEDARQTLKKNKIAAYIILPADFSKSIRSIDGNLQKAKICYMVNSELDDSVELDVYQDINIYLQNLNDNVSYMYVNAIINEFHEAQNGAGIVLQNDNKDLELVSSINGENLLESIQYPEIVEITKNIKDMNFNQEFSVVNSNIQNIESIYDEGDKKAKEKLDSFKSDRQTAESLLQELQKLTVEFNILQDGNGSLVYQDGINELNDFAKKFDADVLQAKKELTLVLDEPEQADDKLPGVAQELAKMKENNKAIQELMQQIQMEYVDIISELPKTANTNEKITLEQGIEDASIQNTDDSLQVEETDDIAETINIEDVTPEETVNIEDTTTEETTNIDNDNNQGQAEDVSEKKVNESESITYSSGFMESNKEGTIENKLKAYERDVELLNEKIQEYSNILTILEEQTKNIKNGIENYPQIDKEELTVIINEQISEPIKKNAEDKQKALQQKAAETNGKYEDYSNKLKEYNAEDYIDKTAINTKKEEMRNLSSSLQDKANEQSEEYREYAENVYDTTQKNLENSEKEIERAYNITKQNIGDMVDTTKSARKLWNDENIQLMDDFTKKLLYSKLGGMANQKMYEFVISPIEIERDY